MVDRHQRNCEECEAPMTYVRDEIINHPAEIGAEPESDVFELWRCRNGHIDRYPRDWAPPTTV